MSENQPSQRSRPRIRLIDLAAMVVGYGLAAILFRAFWPHTGVPPALGIFAVCFYIWLGLAMSGPLLLLPNHSRALEKPATDRAKNRQPSPAADRLEVHKSSLQAAHTEGRMSGPQAGHTWAEMAWLVIGVYWVTLGVFILPVRLQRFRFGDAILFGAVPLLAGLVFYLFGPHDGAHGGETAWTHRMAVWLLLAWPIAWLCLIVVSEAML